MAFDLKKTRRAFPAALTIAGSDSGGNAGVQADIRAFHFFKLHACTVFAALTAQNPDMVSAVENMTPKFVGAQIDAVIGVYSIGALKTGMLSVPEVVSEVADKLAGHREIPAVVDPVMVATSGARLICDEAVETIMRELLPLAALATPNLPEAAVLSGRSVETPADAADAAKCLADKFGCAVLVKGGHSRTNPAEDIFYDGCDLLGFKSEFIKEPVSTHGTGCSLSAAITAALAQGDTLTDAVRKGKAYVYESIRTGMRVGPSAFVLGTPESLPLDACLVDNLRKTM